MKLFAAGLAESGGSQSTLLVALDRLLAPPATVLLDGDAAKTRAWQAALERAFRPDACIVDIAGGDAPAALRKGPVPAGGAAAWVCRGLQCLPPVTTLEGIESALAVS